jgi:hypothetical protein
MNPAKEAKARLESAIARHECRHEAGIVNSLMALVLDRYATDQPGYCTLVCTWLSDQLESAN